jgi:hypothetical protein
MSLLMSDISDQPKLSVPMYVWPLLGVVVLFVIAVGRPFVQGTVKVPVPTTELAPGHLIAQTDLIYERHRRYGLGEVARSRSAVSGRVAITDLRRGEPIPLAALTRKVPSDYGGLIPLRLRSEKAATVDVKNGERVMLHFAPTLDSETLLPASIDAVLLDSAKDGDATVYFVAIAPDDRNELLRLVGRSRLLVTSR